MTPLDAPLFPERSWVDDRARALAEATPLGGTAAFGRRLPASGTVFALEHWVRGGSFHRYGLRAYEQLIADGMTLEEALEHVRHLRGWVSFDGRLRSGGRGMWWSVSYRRDGLLEANGGNSGYSTVEDCAYAALTLIEEHEREVYEESLVVGIA